MITDKCKEEFEKWFANYQFKNFNYNDRILFNPNHNKQLNLCWGFYLEYFDGIGLIIEIAASTDSDLIPNGYWEWYITDLKNLHNDYFNKKLISSRLEAQKQAIEKANEIFNKTLEKTKI